MTTSPTDTIAAIATPPGEGGLAVIRISGPEALGCACRIFKSGRGPSGTATDLARVPSHTVHYGHVVREGRVVDEVLVTVLRSPKSFTREDTVEISCHGGPRVSAMVLDAVLAAGARMAEPGEFTQRAFLNGRMDLAQAEAVADLIHARTRRAVAAAAEQLAGGLSRRIEPLREELMRVLAHVEAYIDFPDEDIRPETGSQLWSRLEAIDGSLEALLRTAGEGRVLRQGLRTVIVGRPNAGKSSLLNRLLNQDRAIVSAIPGTTRDTLEEVVELRGIPVVLVDTAGLREAGDVLEAEGIRRSRVALESADLSLLVLDGSGSLSGEDLSLLAETSHVPRVVVANKSDLPRRAEFPGDVDPIWLSCRTGAGFEALEAAIESAASIRTGDAEHAGVAVNLRHADALRRTLSGLRTATEALRSGIPADLVAVDLRVAAAALGEICGKTATEDLLDLIFSQFCLGK